MIDALRDIAAEFGDIFGPLITAAEDPGTFVDLLAELGWTVAAVPKPITDLIGSGSDLVNAWLEDASAAVLLSAIQKFVRALGAIASRPDSDFTNDVDIATFRQTIGRDLLDYAVCEHLLTNRSRIGLSLQLAGVIRLTDREQAGRRLPHLERRFAWEEIASIFSDPAKGFCDAFAWTSQNPQTAYALAVFGSLLESLGLRFFYYRPDDQQRALIASLTGAEGPQNGLDLVFGPSLGLPDGASAGIQLALGSAQDGSGGSVFVFPYAQSVPDSGQSATELSVSGSGTLASGLAFAIRPGSGVEVHTGFRGGSPGSGGEFSLKVQTAPPKDGTEVVLVGSPQASRFAARSVSVSVGTRSGSGDSLDASVGLALNDARIVIRSESGETDGFIGSLLGSGALDLDFSIGLTFSSATGFHLSGAEALTGTFVVNKTIGPLTVGAIVVGLIARDGGLDLEAGAIMGVQIGPVAATVDDLGIRLSARFPSRPSGNLAFADVTVSFKPPTGVGLSIDAAGVTGGGFLSHDDVKQEYAGVVQLQFADLTLQGFGLITTQVAGASGYSLLALIDATFPPVQLGWGFTLNGVGGLLALHRTASSDALEAALKANTLSQVLFPKAAITNAPLVLAQLDSLFPTAPGRFLFSPMALIGWGTPTLLTAAIAVVVELPEPVRIVLIARVAVRAPSESAAVVRLNMDALGVLDFAKGEASLDATLYDSHILNYTLSGDMALRASWSSNREFLLAVGGFHPQFTPPPGFPSLKRITISMPSGPISKLTMAAYFAITSNTLQLGASIDAFIGVSDFGLKGHLGFNALLQYTPFHFDADISVTVALMAGSDELMSVDVSGMLSGPNPWSIAGSFKISLLFFDVHLSFSHTWGAAIAEGGGVAAVNVLPLLTAAFADARNWHAPLGAGAPKLVSTRDSAGAMKAHPLAVLEVHQTVAPLDLAIDRYGTAPVEGAKQFTITGFTVGGSAEGKEDVQEDFAPAQYFELSEDEKLARPSFELHNAGARMSGTAARTSGFVPKPVAYKTLYVDKTGEIRKDTPPRHGPIWELGAVLETGAGGRGSMRSTGNERYRAPGAPVRVAAPQFVIVDTQTMAVAAISPPGGATYSAARAALAAAGAGRAQLRLVATHETQE
jgi:hypothetical protein